MPIRMPHSGRHATGSMIDFPSFCKYFILFLLLVELFQCGVWSLMIESEDYSVCFADGSEVPPLPKGRWQRACELTEGYKNVRFFERFARIISPSHQCCDTGDSPL